MMVVFAMRRLSGKSFMARKGLLADWLLRDYATWTNMQDNMTSTAMSCDYKMVGAII